MAGDWIKVEHCLPDKPEVHKLAELLKITPDAVVGKLIRLWIWADQHALRNGDAPSVTEALLCSITGHESFAKQLRACGWLREHKNTLFFPNFKRHNSQPAKARALAAKRASKMRNAKSVTKPLQKAHQRREEKNKPPIVPLSVEEEVGQLWLSVHVGTPPDREKVLAIFKEKLSHHRDRLKEIRDSVVDPGRDKTQPYWKFWEQCGLESENGKYEEPFKPDMTWEQVLALRTPEQNEMIRKQSQQLQQSHQSQKSRQS